MSYFDHRNGILHAEDVPLTRIADEVGTAVHVYSAAALRASADAFSGALARIGGARLAFAVKANPNITLLRLLASRGYGADIVSGGELSCALAAGMAPKDIVFSGVGKTDAEMIQALEAGIGQFNLELEEEGAVLSALAAARGLRAPAVLRINPDVDAGTHAKISTGRRENKFGVPIVDAAAMYDRLAGHEGLDLRGVAVHIGSQLHELAPLEQAYSRVGALISELRAHGHAVSQVDLGGGLGVPYAAGEITATLADYASMVERITADWNVVLTFEPGRIIVAASGLLLTRVIWVKPGVRYPYVIVDAAMNDLVRPAMYGAIHRFEAVAPDGRCMIANIAGPVCETGDTFALASQIDRVQRGDLAVFHTTGAYGASMASTYNCRPIIPQVLVDGAGYDTVGGHVEPFALAADQQRRSI